MSNTVPNFYDVEYVIFAILGILKSVRFRTLTVRKRTLLTGWNIEKTARYENWD